MSEAKDSRIHHLGASILAGLLRSGLRLKSSTLQQLMLRHCRSESMTCVCSLPDFKQCAASALLECVNVDVPESRYIMRNYIVQCCGKWARTDSQP